MTDPITTPRHTPNGSESSTGIYREDSQPNAAPTPAVPQGGDDND
jgi:hypothetical protein